MTLKIYFFKFRTNCTAAWRI